MANSKECHRQQLREKFLKNGLGGFHDYEIIELLLSLGTPRTDCKQQAIDVSVHNHLIIAGNDVSSFADHGLI